MPQERNCILGCKRTPSMFSFPSKEKDPERRKQWKRLLGVKGSVSKRIFACQRHFSFKMAAGRRLRRNAVPDIGVCDVDNELSDPTCSFLNQLNGSEVPALRQIGNILTTAVKKRQTTEFFCNKSTTVESSKISDSESDTDNSCTYSECYDGSKETVPTINQNVTEISTTAGKTIGILPENYNNNLGVKVCSDATEVIDISRADAAGDWDDTIPESSFSPEYIIERLDSSNEDESLEEPDAPDNNLDMVMDEVHLDETEYVELPNPDEPFTNIPDEVTKDLNHDKSIHISRLPKISRRRRVKMVKKSVQTSPIRSESISPSREQLTEEIKTLKAQIKVQDKEMREIYRRRGKLLKRLKLLKNGNDHQLLEGFCNRLPAGLGRFVRKKVKAYYTTKTRHLSIPYIQKNTEEMEQVEYPTLYEDYE